MRGIGSMIAGGDNKNRQKDDFYPTPQKCIRALLDAEQERLQCFPKIWEPACGDGAICKELMVSGFDVFSSDIINRGYQGQDSILDFMEYPVSPAQAIITNPPFVLAEKFIRQAFALDVCYLALLLKSTFWHAAKRTLLFEQYQPARIYALTWRPDFLEKGAPTMDCIWCVWDNQNPVCGETRYYLLKEPKR